MTTVRSRCACGSLVRRYDRVGFRFRCEAKALISLQQFLSGVVHKKILVFDVLAQHV